MNHYLFGVGCGMLCGALVSVSLAGPFVDQPQPAFPVTRVSNTAPAPDPAMARTCAVLSQLTQDERDCLLQVDLLKAAQQMGALRVEQMVILSETPEEVCPGLADDAVLGDPLHHAPPAIPASAPRIVPAGASAERKGVL